VLGMCYILCMCVCVGVSDMTTVGHFPRGVPGGGKYAPPLDTRNVRGSTPNFFFGAIFAIFNRFCYF
jgi:hypothetical protein